MILSARKTEGLIDETDFARRSTFSSDAMTAADDALERTMIASMMLFGYLEVRCSTSLRVNPSFFRRTIALRYDASLPFVTDDGR